MKKIIIFSIFSILLLSNTCLKEIDYEKAFTKKLKLQNIKVKENVVLSNGLRPDLAIKNYIIEVDYAKKYYEAIGQSLVYSTSTNLNPAIVLIMTNDNDDKYLKRLIIVAKKYKIKVWTIDTKFDIKMEYQPKNSN